MAMAPQLWPLDPQKVNRDYKARHGVDLPGAFIWAVWAAEGSDYLEKLDDGHPGKGPLTCGPSGGAAGNRTR
jgi:hypothetical protein